MIRLSIKPVKELSWKRRRAGGGSDDKGKGDDSSRDDEVKSPSDYIFQANRLSACLSSLREEVSVFPNKKYVRFFFFPEESEVQDQLKEYFEETYNIDFVEAEPRGLHSVAFFEILDTQYFIQSLDRDIALFEKYASSEGDAVLEDRRITLVREFELLTPDRVDLVVEPENPVKVFSFAVQSVRPGLVSVSDIQTCAASLGLQIAITQTGDTILETDIVREINESEISPKTLREFLGTLKQMPGLKRIYLNKTVTVEYSGFASEIKKQLPNIEKPLDTSPIIAVIDSGVECNQFTEHCFIEGEGISLDPTDPNPQTDKLGHGTEVTSRILYGHTLESDIIPERKALLPVGRIFPVKLYVVDAKEGKLEVDWHGLFSKEGELAKSVEKLGIKLINLSINCAYYELNFPDRAMSEIAARIDAFSKALGVIVVNSTGNILPDSLVEFMEIAGKNGFEKIDYENDQGKYLRVIPPADFLSGISTGSCWRPIGKSQASPSWFSRCLPAIDGKSPSKPDCLAIGGDFDLTLSTQPIASTLSSSKALITAKSTGDHVVTDDYLYMNVGTSISAPHVTRALAIIMASFPEATVETIKGLFLHRASTSLAKPTKQTDDSVPQPVKLHPCFRGASLFAEEDEILFIAGRADMAVSDDLTYAIEGSVKHEKVLYYDIPLAEFRKLMENRKDHRIRIRLSISYLPSLPAQYDFSKTIPFKDANQIHIAGCLHSPAVEPVYNKETIINGKKGKIVSVSPNTLTTTTAEWISHGLLSWTKDYYGVVQTPFSTKKTKAMSFEEFEKKIGNHDSIRLSLRCYIKDPQQENIPQQFSAILSLEDLGAYAKAEAIARVDAEVQVE